MADIERSVEIEQIDYNVDINNVSYSIDILPQNTYTIELNEQGPQGLRGYTGNGIESYELTSTAGLIDTYTITFTDGETKTVDVTNGADGTSADITSVTATIDSNVGIPSVDVTLGGTELARTIAFDFHNLKGQDGNDGAAATISVGTVTTGQPTDPAGVTNVGTSSAAIFDFTIPKGDKGDTGDTGATGNGVVDTEYISSSGLVDTYHLNFTNGSYGTFTVTNGRDGSDGNVQDVLVDNVSVLDGTVAKIDLTPYLKNIATATDAISVYGTANTQWINGINIGSGTRITSNNGVAIGVDATADINAVAYGRDANAGTRGTAIGAYAKTSYDTGIAIGCWNANTNNAKSTAKGAYQFGVGTNNTARTLNVGWYDDSVTPSTFRNYQLLDGNTGLIPDARISSNIARASAIPTDTADLTNGAGYISGITSGDVTGALGYTPYPDTNPNGYTSNIGTVTSVNNVSPIGGNVSISIPTDTGDLTNSAGYITSAALTNYVTTDTAQTISGRKTFTGEKAIYFKQSNTSDKLGFTLYNPSNTELGALEWRPNTISGNALLALNCPQSGTNYVGFRYWSNINIVAPRPTTNGNYFIPVNVTDGNTTVTANSNGTLDISSLLPSGTVVDQVYDSTSANAQSGVAIAGANFLTSGDLKTINNTSIVGVGDIDTSEIFIAVVAVSTYNEVFTAYSNNKVVVALFGGQIYYLQSVDTNEIVFITYFNDKFLCLTLDDQDNWTPSSISYTNTDLSNISATGQKVIDGQWDLTTLTVIASNVTYPTSGTGTEYNISAYLPNDSYNYEVLICGSITTGTTSGNPCQLNIKSDLFGASNYVTACGTRTRANANTYATNTFILPVGTGRKLIVVPQSNLVGTYQMWLSGYRRIGTNS